MRTVLTLGVALLAGCTDLPTSTSTRELPELEILVEVQGESVQVDGEAVEVTHDQGQVIAPVREALVRRAVELGLRGSGEAGLALEVHPEVRCGLLVDLVYTAAQAGFGEQWLVVEGAGGQVRGIPLSRASISAEAAAAPAAAPTAGSWANPRLALDPSRGFVLHAVDRVVDSGSGLVVPCAHSPCQDWPLAELARLGRRVKLDHPRDRAIMVAPDPDLPVQTLVHALDAVRDDALVGQSGREAFSVVHLSTAVEAP